ncbi:NUDIX domain-containing protein [Streptomyces sp. NPDC006512]|uniref:NUDIX domain-containing protein n=1 Tax=Streptomyces sp. NPDC006512 TaxID=3154307 RepID=UPI0033A6A12B
MSAADEVHDVVDRDDRVVGRAPRGEVYARGLIHRCVFVQATDARGRIFVHRRTASKLVFPSYYDMFVGGVLGAGEDYAGAALREAEEELGVRGLEQPVPLFKFLYEGPGGTWWSSVFEVRCELPVSPQVSEVDWHTWLTLGELERRVADGEWPWVPDGLAAYGRLREFREARQ